MLVFKRFAILFVWAHSSYNTKSYKKSVYNPTYWTARSAVTEYGLKEPTGSFKVLDLEGPRQGVKQGQALLKTLPRLFLALAKSPLAHMAGSPSISVSVLTWPSL